MSERDFDQAVDRAVRDMMHVDASAGFEQRVRAAIASRPHRTSRWMPFAALGTMAAAAAAVLLFVVTQPEQPQQETPPVSMVLPNTPPPTRERPAPISPTHVKPAPGPMRASASRGIAVSRDVPVPAEPVSNIAPLDDINPIEVARVETPAIAPATISIQPLAPIAPLNVEPLPSRGRN